MKGKKRKNLAEATGKVVRDLRKAKNLSQEALALEADLQRNYISMIERGLNNPTLLVLSKVALALDISLSKLVKQIEDSLDG